MAIPRKIRLKDATYQVKIRRSKGYHGLCYPSDKRIQLSPNPDRQELYLTFIHECLHGLLHEHGYEAKSEEAEEAFVLEVEKNIKRFFIAKETI
jgi:G:T-mismatch repair DNA endonuclease (very short patch repair protein)